MKKPAFETHRPKLALKTSILPSGQNNISTSEKKFFFPEEHHGKKSCWRGASSSSSPSLRGLTLSALLIPIPPSSSSMHIKERQPNASTSTNNTKGFSLRNLLAELVEGGFPATHLVVAPNGSLEGDMALHFFVAIHLSPLHHSRSDKSNILQCSGAF